MNWPVSIDDFNGLFIYFFLFSFAPSICSVSVPGGGVG